VSILDFHAKSIVPILAQDPMIFVGWLAISAIRRWMGPASSAANGFTLDDLRRLRKAGQMTEEEFSRAREAMLGSVRSKSSAVVPSTKLQLQQPPPANPRTSVRIAPPKRPPGLDDPRA
jgi:hypothetical protein